MLVQPSCLCKLCHAIWPLTRPVVWPSPPAQLMALCCAQHRPALPCSSELYYTSSVVKLSLYWRLRTHGALSGPWGHWVAGQLMAGALLGLSWGWKRAIMLPFRCLWSLHSYTLQTQCHCSTVWNSSREEALILPHQFLLGRRTSSSWQHLPGRNTRQLQWNLSAPLTHNGISPANMVYSRKM